MKISTAVPKEVFSASLDGAQPDLLGALPTAGELKLDDL